MNIQMERFVFEIKFTYIHVFILQRIYNTLPIVKKILILN